MTTDFSINDINIPFYYSIYLLIYFTVSKETVNDYLDNRTYYKNS